ncbi:BlaI/MecI/CopY family transcriptional regulator [Clostridioides difficile]|uniref:BlaI/MecI/CopY family transcriptional regulator n=1 Tax=Clostridioides difficile TaxID=1496 RepID=UPI0029C4E123|nr:BlaI/MecI/CopY family transcriptional regulator [Clostridioides difficile]MDX5678726.1 BlaI/MecI/CopY family transcriptional regulator [Clostridioides difficile]
MGIKQGINIKRNHQVYGTKYEWKDTTIFTVLKRLQRREFLEKEKIDKRTHYNVLVKEK